MCAGVLVSLYTWVCAHAPYACSWLHLCLCARQLWTQSSAWEKAAAASGVLGAGCYHTRSGTACA